MARNNTSPEPAQTTMAAATDDAKPAIPGEIAGTPAPAGRPTVRVRVKHGRVLVQRKRLFDDAVDERGRVVGRVQVGTEDIYKNKGDIFDMDAEEAERLLKRSFEGYPSLDGQPGKVHGIVNDSPIEIVQSVAA